MFGRRVLVKSINIYGEVVYGRWQEYSINRPFYAVTVVHERFNVQVEYNEKSFTDY